jgi:flagellar hook-basal body complex protein FliE
MDVRSISALKNYNAARPATRPETGFEKITTEALSRSFGDFSATLQNGEQVAMSAMTTDADPHALVQALAQTELAVETAVTVRNKVVEAYQEILRMPV